MTRVIGIDPGSVTTGYGVVDERGRELVYVASGTIRTNPKEPLPGRLKKIYDELLFLFRTHQPSEVAIEDTFVSNNVQSALKLGQARGMALLAAEQDNTAVYEYTPTQVKKSVVGYGAARKDQVGGMVSRLLNLKVAPESHDAADALAVAICHLHSVKIRTLSGLYAEPKKVMQVRFR